MLDNEVRVVGSGVAAEPGPANWKRNFDDTVAFIDQLATVDPAFKPALDGIKKRLKSEFTTQFPSDISQIENVKGSNPLILKFPRNIFANSYSPKEAIEFLLRGFLRFVNSHLNPTVKSQDLIEHLEPQIAQIITGKEREAQENQVLQFLGTVDPIGAENFDIGKDLARPKTKPSRKDDDTVLEGSGDTVIFKRAKAQSSEDSNTKVLGEKGEHDELYKTLFRNMVSIYRSKPNETWKGFAAELNKVANNKDSTASVIANIINVLYKIKSDNPDPSSEESILEQVLKDLKKNLAFYIIETQANNQDKVKAFLCESISLVSNQDLLEAIRSEFDSKEFSQELRSFNTKSMKASTSDLPLSLAAMKSADPNQLRLGVSGGSGQLRLTGTSAGSEIKLVELPVHPDFLELTKFYPSQKMNANYLAANLADINFNTENPFAKSIPSGILLCLEKALERESLKKQDPISEELKYFTHFNEMTEYLKTLANALNSCPEFLKLCKKYELNMSPAKFALTQILIEFVGSNTNKQTAYFQALESLESLDDFKGMKSMIENIQASKMERAKAKLYEKIDAEANEILSTRVPLRAELIGQLEDYSENSPGRIKRMDFWNLGKPNSETISEQSAQGFLRRLLLPHLADANTIFLLDQHKDEALYEIYYLITGNILLNSTNNKEIKIYDPKNTNYHKLSFNEFLEEFSKGLQSCRASFHTDKKESFLKVLGRDFDAQSICKTIENNSSQLFEDVKNLANSGEGWDRNKFGQKIQELRNQLEDSGLISIITGSSDSPTSTRETAIAARKQGKQQVSLINTLSNIWRAISGSITNADQQQIASIESDLKKLTA